MAQRISRAKRTVARAGLDRPGDVPTVMRVLYLIFNEGYSGDVDLAAEAIRLTRQLASSANEPEVHGLLALMLLHHARRPSRARPDGRRPKRRSPGSTPMRQVSRTPTGSRSWSGTTSCCSSPTRGSSGSTVPSPSAKRRPAVAGVADVGAGCRVLPGPGDLRPSQVREGPRCTRRFRSHGSAAHPGSAAWRVPPRRRPAGRIPARSRRHGSSGPRPR